MRDVAQVIGEGGNGRSYFLKAGKLLPTGVQMKFRESTNYHTICTCLTQHFRILDP
jgi:hypothetical protein